MTSAELAICLKIYIFAFEKPNFFRGLPNHIAKMVSQIEVSFIFDM